MFRLLCICACLLVQFANTASIDKRQTVIDTGTHILVCEQEPIELGIVLDSSVSISRRDFQKGIEFLQSFLDQFEIGPGRNEVRVSIITFGRGVYPQDAFNLTAHSTKESVIGAIGRVPHRQGRYTSTGEGIEYMTLNQLAEQYTRSWAERVSIVLTDGDSQEGDVTKAAAEAARAAGIITFAIGVGRVKDKELENIAGDKGRVYKVDNYNELDKIKSDLAHKTCVKTKKTTTPMPLTVCGETSPADIYFLFSPAELGLEQTSWTTSFIASVINQEEMEEGFRFGVGSGSCPDDEGFDLDEYQTKREIENRLAEYVSRHMPAIVERVVTTGYTSAHGGRPDAQDVAILIAEGGKKSRKLKTEVDNLIAQGVRVFIADPSGKGISFEGATTLTGDSYKDVAVNLVTYLCPVRT